MPDRETLETLARLNRDYVCPSDAGPKWCAAMEAGCDMSLLEHMLSLGPEERLNVHQRKVDFLLSIYGAELRDFD